MISLGLLSKLWGLSWVRGLALSVGVLVAVISWGALKRRDGYSEGYREAKRITEAAWDADAKLARDVAAGIKARTDTLTRALRDSLAVQTQLVSRLREQAALARGQYAEALRAYQEAQSYAGPPSPAHDSLVARTCSAALRTCDAALTAAEREKDGLVMQLRTAEALAVAQTDYATKEPERWKPVIADALAEQRRSFQAPSRTRWFALGAAAGRASCELRR